MSKKEQKEKARIAGSSEGRKPDPDLFHNHELSLLQFNARVLDEVLVPVHAAPIRSYLMFVLETYLNDNSQRWVLQPDGDYKRCYPKDGEPGKGAHRMFMEHTAAMEDPVPAAFEIPGASI
ncbi:MAG: hypothetical protein EA363_02790 [Balneolaceae bacterium]|nr:MAG: hypothetical protein EA363_02790 [Balneolaceae bacterium]